MWDLAGEGRKQNSEMADYLRDLGNKTDSLPRRGSIFIYLKSWSLGPRSPSYEANYVVPVVWTWHVGGNWETGKCICVFYCRKLRAFICCMRVEALVALLCSLRHYLTVAPSASQTFDIS